MSHNNRPPPAYQEYASDVLASRSYRMMSLAERGLWDQMRKECWVNRSIPSQPEKLAKYLGLPLADVEGALTTNVQSCFDDDGEAFVCPELEDYRKKLEEKRRSMAEGGARGGKKTQAKYKNSRQAPLEANSEALRRSELNRIGGKGEELINKEVLSPDNMQWVNDYERGDRGSDRYSQQSNGY